MRVPCIRLRDHFPRGGLPGIATAKDYLAANFAAAKTFKVETKRGDKKFPMT